MSHEMPGFARTWYQPTGRPEIDVVLDRLGELDGRPPRQHIEIYEDVHRRLHDVLLEAGEASDQSTEGS